MSIAELNINQSQTVPSMLRAAAKLYEQRNAMYGNNYHEYGKMMVDLFGHIELKSVSDYNRFAIVTHIATRLTRYAKMFSHGGHDDSLDDICVYTMMLKELDIILRSNGTFNGDDN